MKFLFDHDVPDDLAHLLRHNGHQVTLLREVLPRRAPDREVLALARSTQSVLVTCNREDFRALAQREEHCGLILLFRRRTRAQEKAALSALIERAGPEGIDGNVNFA